MVGRRIAKYGSRIPFQALILAPNPDTKQVTKNSAFADLFHAGMKQRRMEHDGPRSNDLDPNG